MITYTNMTRDQALFMQRSLVRQGLFFNIRKDNSRDGVSHYLLPTTPKGFRPRIVNPHKVSYNEGC